MGLRLNIKNKVLLMVILSLGILFYFQWNYLRASLRELSIFN